MKIKNLFLVIFCLSFCLVFTTCKKDDPITSHIRIKVLFKNLQNPWGKTFLPNGDFLFVERNGNINLQKNGSSDYNLIMYRNIQLSEGGLLGITPDPDFTNNHYIYIYETVDSNRVVRLKMENDVLTQDKIICHGIPKANNHDGGGLKFGPDGYLYLGTGDATQRWLAQDLNSLAGKILRMDRDGNVPPGNPFNTLVWTYGHRNVQGFDWNAQGKMIATEHGPTGEFGWFSHDEVNLIIPGKNYGWPDVLGTTDSMGVFTPPIYCTENETWAPSGCTFIKGKQWGNWEGNFILGALKAQKLVRLAMNASGDAIISRNDTLEGTFMRLRNIIQAPDGSLIFSSSNIGPPISVPLDGDDKIYRMYIE